MYRVHKFEVHYDINEAMLQVFLNALTGEVVSIVPNLVPKFHMMGATAGCDCLIIVEKLAEETDS